MTSLVDKSSNISLVVTYKVASGGIKGMEATTAGLLV